MLMLRRPRYELMPVDGVEDLVAGVVPPEVGLTLTMTEERGIEATLAQARRLVAAGFEVTPHLAARLVRDKAHLGEILARVFEYGIRDLFVVGGDAPVAAGKFSDALGLLRALAATQHGRVEVGVTGHPWSRPTSADPASRVLLAKQSLATYVVTDFCLDARTLAAWLAGIRRLGFRLPVRVGLPGPVGAERLARISRRLGVKPQAYDPDSFLQELGPALAFPENRVAGLSFFTFNQVAVVENWRRRKLAALAAG
ncbi:MAG: methylenetetrahydrofolate reductase [Candidatus Dormibacteraeota bacterium]|nr:methylenetetrahydrofolate reductase [Candidatus Dormibacteraeota bacterium]